MAGVSCKMDELNELAQVYQHPQYGPLKIIGDAARATGVTYKNTKVGFKGWASVFSFHSAKLMTTLGEGGMITTNDSDLAAKLYDMRDYGGADAWGMNYRLSKVQAAVGLIQLKRLDEMNDGIKVSVACSQSKTIQAFICF